MRSSCLAAALAGLLFLSPRVEAQSASVRHAASTPDQWREDLRFMTREITQRHANPYHRVPKAEFERAVAELDANIPQLQRNQVIVGMMRIAAMVGDGHTRVEPRKDPAFGFPSLPLKFYLFDDGVFVRAAKPEQRALLGARVVAVGGVPIDEAIRRVSELASRENAMGPMLYAPLYLAMPDILQAVGLSRDRSTATLTVSRDGRQWTVTVPAAGVDPVWPPDTDISLVTPPGWLDARAGPTPMWLQAPLVYHRLIDLPDRHALYAQINMVTDVDGETLGRFGEKILAKATATNPKAVVIDLRLAQGGNGDLRTDLIRSLIKTEDDDTRIFVLTARGTFSASQFILDDLDRLTSATFVGEPASSSPTGYGDGYRSQMPNSRIAVRTSILHWQSGQNFAPWTYVDIAAPYRFPDYAAGRDPALEAALAFSPDQRLEERLLAGAAKGADAIGRIFDDPAYRYADLERAGWRTAMRLLRDKQQAAALTLARGTAARFDRSSDAATVHAMIAEAAGDRSAAEAQARRALQLDRNNRNARSLLEKVTGKPQ
jgi:hypothetical protein